MIDSSKANSEFSRIETLLHQTASFEPDEPMPSTISNRLLSARQSGRKHSRAWLAPASIAAFSVCAASVALLALFGHRPSKTPHSVPTARIALAGPDFHTGEQPANLNAVPLKR